MSIARPVLVCRLELRFKLWKHQLMARNKAIAGKIQEGINGIGIETHQEGFMFAPFIRYIIIKSLALKQEEADNAESNYVYQSWIEIYETQKQEELFVQLSNTATRVLTDYCVSAINQEFNK